MYEVTRYVANDGTEFKNPADCIKHEAEQHGRTYLCPKCKGKRTVNGEPQYESRYDRELTANMGSMTDLYSKQLVGYEQITCDVCDGFGYTKDEVVPITKTVVTGYTKA